MIKKTISTTHKMVKTKITKFEADVFCDTCNKDIVKELSLKKNNYYSHDMYPPHNGRLSLITIKRCPECISNIIKQSSCYFCELIRKKSKSRELPKTYCKQHLYTIDIPIICFNKLESKYIKVCENHYNFYKNDTIFKKELINIKNNIKEQKKEQTNLFKILHKKISELRKDTDEKYVIIEKNKKEIIHSLKTHISELENRLLITNL